MVFSVNGGNRQNVEAKPPVNSALLSSLFWGGPFQQVIDLFHRYVLDYMYLHICKDFKGLPRQCSGKESATAGDTGPIPHALEQLNLCTTITEPVLQSLGSAASEPMCYKY